MAAGAPAAFCRTSRRGFASPQSARSSYRCVRVRIITRPLLTGDRGTDHDADIHSVIRHNDPSSSGIVGDDRQGRSIVSQHGCWWPVEHWAGENPRTRYNSDSAPLTQSWNTQQVCQLFEVTFSCTNTCIESFSPLFKFFTDYTPGSQPTCSSPSVADLPCSVLACGRLVPASLPKCSNQLV